MKSIKKETFGEITVVEGPQLRLSLGDLIAMAMARPLVSDRSTAMAGPCVEWEFALHAFFDGELDMADSMMCEQHLAQCPNCSLEVENLNVMRRKIKRFAMGWSAGWSAPTALRARIR